MRKFCIILTDRSLENGIEIAERVRCAIETELAIPYAVTSSVGVSSTIFGASSGQALIDQADKALYMAKHAGRNQTQTFSEEMFKQAENKDAAAKADNKSQYNEIAISYQAAVSLHTALLYKHAPTAYHSQRVAELSLTIARNLLSVRDLYLLEVAALLHDLGKIAATDEFLNHQCGGQLSMDSEPHQTMVHDGVRIIQTSFDSKELIEAVEYHLYRFDGTHPGQTLVGDDIPLTARIICIANAYDELVTGNSSTPGMSHEQAMLHLELGSGTRFDPELIKRFATQGVGWRIDGSYIQVNNQSREVIDLGFNLEQALLAYDGGDVAKLQRRLEMIRDISKRLGFENISRIASELHRNLDRKTAADLDGFIPVLQDLIECCSAILRGHLRTVASSSAEPIRH